MTFMGNVLEMDLIDQYDSDFYKRSAEKNQVNPAEKLYPRVVSGRSFGASLATESAR